MNILIQNIGMCQYIRCTTSDLENLQAILSQYSLTEDGGSRFEDGELKLKKNYLRYRMEK